MVLEISPGGEPYPFVEKRGLKSRARVNQRELSKQDSFLVIFCEGTIPSEHSKYIRFFDTNKLTKEAINEIANIELSTDNTRNLRYFDNPNFEGLLLDLLPQGYAVLIQKNLVQDKKSDRINRMNKIILFFIMVNPKFTIS